MASEHGSSTGGVSLAAPHLPPCQSGNECCVEALCLAAAAAAAVAAAAEDCPWLRTRHGWDDHQPPSLPFVGAAAVG